MKKPTKKDMLALVEQWRALVPPRPMLYGEHIQYAHVQAYHVRGWLDHGEPDVNLVNLLDQRLIPVEFVPSHVLDDNSGLTTDLPDGRLQVFLNENHPPTRQRYSLMHEWKHVLDFYLSDLLYRDIGHGDAEKQHDLREAVANEFAAHVLMPTMLVKRVWFATQDISLAASAFNVSLDAMATRLKKLGLIGERKPRPHTYFRGPGMTNLDHRSLAAYAA
jgi:hypothetical protein